VKRLSPHALPGVVAAVTCLVLALTSAPASAGDPRDESRAAFLRGVNEAHQDHFTAARDAFLEAYRLFPHPSILMNLGIARMRTGEYIASEENLVRFLADPAGAPPEDLANARAALVVVRGHIGTLRVRVSPTTAHATLDGAPLTLTPSTFVDVRAVVGPAELRVAADGYAPVARAILVQRDQVELADVILVPASGPGRAPETAPTGDHAASRHATLGWALVGTAGVLGVTGVIAGVEAISLAHDYNTPGNAEYQNHPTREEGVAWRTSADVLFATGLVAAGVGAYILVRPIKSDVDVHVALRPSFVGVVGRF
jgi:hypothetical protein